MADNKGERDTEKMISISLGSASSKLRKTFNLKDNPSNLGKQARFYGSQTTYLGIIGIKNPGSYKLFDWNLLKIIKAKRVEPHGLTLF